MIERAKIRFSNIIPASINWQESPELRLEYKTDIRKFEDGTEERDSAVVLPRATISFDAMFVGEAISQFNADLMFKFNEEWVFQFPSAPLNTAAAGSGAHVITILDDIPLWLMPGCRVIIEYINYQFTTTVISVVGNLVTITDALPFALGNGKMFRAFSGYYADAPRQRYRSSSTMTCGIEMMVNPSMFSLYDGYSFDTYNGVEVLTKNPNWASQPDRISEIERDIVDFGFGKVSYSDKYDYPNETISAAYFAMGSDEMDKLIGFVHRRLGMRNEFWMPGLQQEIVQSSNSAAASPTLQVPSAFVDDLEGKAEYQRIFADFGDGTFAVRTVAGAFISVSGITVIPLSAPFGSKFTENTKVRWLTRRRLASDSLTFKFMTSTVGSSNLPSILLKG